MQLQRFKSQCRGLPLVALACLPHVANAQTAEAQPADAEAMGLEQIIVTAQRRSESLVDVPLSIQAVSGDALQNRGIQSMGKLELATPGLVVNDAFGFYNPFLRGIGNTVSGSYTENSVAVYVDDVPRPRMTGNTSLVSLERIEVLKGPQGALYGRNATGGAINIITREPSDEFAVIANATAGQYSTANVEGYVNVPLTDRVAANFSASKRKHDGYEDNLAAGGNPVNDQDIYSFDGKLRWQAGDNLRLTLRGDYVHKEDAAGYGWHQQVPGSVAEIQQALAAGGALAVVALPPSTQRSYFLAASFPVPGAGGATLPQLVQAFNPSFNAAALNPLPTLQSYAGFGKTYMDQKTGDEKTEAGGSLKAEWSLPGVDITSITGYRDVKSVGSVEIDATQVPFQGFGSDFHSKTATQELRFLSNGAGPLQWLTGASYFQDRNEDQILARVYGLPFAPGDIASKLDVDAYAAFGQLTYDITDALSVIGSVRYSHEKKEVTYPAQIATLGQEVVADKTESKVTPSATLNYELSDGGVVYLRYAQGFKSGGINSYTSPFALGAVDANGNPVAIPNTFKPEKIDSVELGFKRDFLDNQLRFTSAAFYYVYRDLQVQRTGGPAGGTSFIVNADRARVFGLDADLAAQITSSLTAAVSLALVDGEYTDFKSTPQTVAFGIAPFDDTGNQMLNSPKVSASISLDYTQPITSGLAFDATAIGSYRSKFFYDAEETPGLEQSAYVVANFRAGIRADDRKWGVYAFVDNAFDEDYLTGGQTNAAGVVAVYAAPRVFGGTVEVRF